MPTGRVRWWLEKAFYIKLPTYLRLGTLAGKMMYVKRVRLSPSLEAPESRFMILSNVARGRIIPTRYLVHCLNKYWKPLF